MIKIKQLIMEASDYQDLINFVERNSWFSFEEDDKTSISFSTRDNGSVYDETPGEVDIDKARELKKQIEKKFNVDKVTVDYADEWVYINVQKPSLKFAKEEDYQKIVKKLEAYLLKVPIPFEMKGWASDRRVETKLPYQLNNAIKFVTTLKVDIDTNWKTSNRPKRVKEIDKWLKKLEQDIKKKFNFKKFETKDGALKQYVTRHGGEGGWIDIIVSSPLLARELMGWQKK